RDDTGLWIGRIRAARRDRPTPARSDREGRESLKGASVWGGVASQVEAVFLAVWTGRPNTKVPCPRDHTHVCPGCRPAQDGLFGHPRGQLARPLRSRSPYAGACGQRPAGSPLRQAGRAGDRTGRIVGRVNSSWTTGEGIKGEARWPGGLPED